MSTPRERLEEAVNAMRDIKRLPGVEWDKSYPEFSIASLGDYLPLVRGSGSWANRVEAMNAELALRTAEFLLREGE